ncbi:MAG: hypothetical protein ACREE4_09810 [Stellaceae bacterium]
MLGALSKGPAFLALLGPPGTGKTWLLQAILTALRQRGQRAMLVPRGELPFKIAAGTVVLIDEAARMGAERLAHLSGVRDASLVLADLPGFADRLKSVARPPTVVRLAPLMPEEIPDFVAAWMALRDVPADIVNKDAMARLVAHSGGVPRLVAQLLWAALAISARHGIARVGNEEVDEAAAFRLGGPDAAAAMTAVRSASSAAAGPASPPAAARPEAVSQAGYVPVRSGEMLPVGRRERIFARPALRSAGLRRKKLRWAGYGVAVPAIAASVLLAFMFSNPRGERYNEITTTVRIPHLEAQIEALAWNVSEGRSDWPADAAGGSESPFGPASPTFGRTFLVPSEPRSDARVAMPLPHRFVLQAAAALSLAKRTPPASGLPRASPTPAVGQLRQTAVPSPAVPTQSIQATAPDLPAAPAFPFARPSAEAARRSLIPQQIRRALAGSSRHAAPGLVLVARAGDTMPALYAKVYQGLRPPPYPEVRVANPIPLRPGAIVIFPAPPGGWTRR